MGVPSDAAIPAGNLARRLTETNSDVAQSRTARRGRATSVGAGGTRFHSGGSATFEDGGGVIVRDGGDIRVEGGSLTAEYPSGRAAAVFGPLVHAVTGAPTGHGLLVQADDDSQGKDVFRAKYENSQRLVYIGEIPATDAAGAVDVSLSNALQQSHHSHGPDGFAITSHSGGGILVQSLDGGNLQALANGTAHLGGDAGTFLQPESTGLAANVHMAADGRILRSTSSARYKTDIQDADVDPGVVLQLRPRTWLPGVIPRACPDWLHEQHQYRPCPADQGPEPPDPDARRQVGFVAEELVDLGLTDFVEFNADGLPEAIYYDRLTAALIPLLQAQQAQITALSERLDTLESTAAGD